MECFHHLNIQGLQTISDWGDEIKQAMDSSVTYMLSIETVLIVKKFTILFIDIFYQRSDAIRTINCIAEP